MTDPTTPQLSVLLVDDQPLLRMGFRLVIDAEPDLRVVGEAGDGADAVAAVHELRPDVVLMDVRMPGTDGIEATRRIVEALPETRVIILTTFDLDDYAFAGLRAGASGFLLKDVLPSELLSSIRTVAAGDAALTPRIAHRMLELFAPHLPVKSTAAGNGADPRLSTLTPREIDVLRVLARGHSNAEIATQLFLSEATVKTHIGRILTKLGLRDRVQAVVLAFETALVTPGE
ncbi:response regulator transcription factor [Salinibacterium sp. ZJ450]|uniref:response regulator n=1 Tax=Salinibacterium sp. ZJ450 TaxID=2708338 RepID=UPI00141EF468|nr:response regulator transcription factor [Salinibacterium sp. ZJ450]